MPELVTSPFTQLHIEAQARINVNALILGSIAYAKAQGHGGRLWVTFLGQALAPCWTGVTTPHEAARYLGLNCASAGMRVVSVTSEGAYAEAVTGDWPDPANLAFFGLSRAEADEVWDFFAPIAQALGLHYTWRRDGSELHFTFSR